jgi:hypothetical protein
LAGLFGAAAVTPGILFRILPSREAVFAAFKEEPLETVFSEQWSVVCFLTQTTVHFKPYAARRN